MGEKGVVRAQDEVACRAFFCDGADDLLNLSLHFSLDVSFCKKYGVFDDVNLGAILKVWGAPRRPTKYTFRNMALNLLWNAVLR